jgi:O-antigen ligase
LIAKVAGCLFVFATMTIWLDVSYAERCCEAALLLLAVIAGWRRGHNSTFMIAALAVLVLWGPFQLITGISVVPYETLTAALRWAALAAAFFVVYESLHDRELIGQARTWLAAFAGIFAVFCTAQAYTSQGAYFWLFPSGQPQVFGPFQNQNNYAAFIELTLPLTLWKALEAGRYRTLWLALAAAMAGSVAASASRAGSALVALELPAVLLVAYCSGHFSRRRVVGIAVKVALAAVLCLAATGWGTLEGRLRAANPFLYRREMLRSAVAMAQDRPWTGFGLGTFSTVYPAYAVFDNGFAVNHAHNDWAEWAAEGGTPFLLLLTAMAAASSFSAIRSGWGVGLVAVYAHGFVDFPMQRTGVAIWVSVLAALLAAELAYNRDRRQHHRAGYAIGAQGAPIAENQFAERSVERRLEAQDGHRQGHFRFGEHSCGGAIEDL